MFFSTQLESSIQTHHDEQVCNCKSDEEGVGRTEHWLPGEDYDVDDIGNGPVDTDHQGPPPVHLSEAGGEEIPVRGAAVLKRGGGGGG